MVWENRSQQWEFEMRYVVYNPPVEISGFTYQKITKENAKEWLETKSWSTLGMGLHEEKTIRKINECFKSVLRLPLHLRIEKSVDRPLQMMAPGDETLCLKFIGKQSDAIFVATGEPESEVVGEWEYGILKRIE